MVKPQRKVTYDICQYATDVGMWTVQRTVTEDRAKTFSRMEAAQLIERLVMADRHEMLLPPGGSDVTERP